MDALSIISLVSTIIQGVSKAAPIVFQGISDAKPFAMDLYSRITGQPVSTADETVIDAMLASLTTRLEAPLPAAQPGDPDYVKSA